MHPRRHVRATQTAAPFHANGIGQRHKRHCSFRVKPAATEPAPVNLPPAGGRKGRCGPRRALPTGGGLGARSGRGDGKSRRGGFHFLTGPAGLPRRSLGVPARCHPAPRGERRVGVGVGRSVVYSPGTPTISHASAGRCEPDRADRARLQEQHGERDQRTEDAGRRRNADTSGSSALSRWVSLVERSLEVVEGLAPSVFV